MNIVKLALHELGHARKRVFLINSHMLLKKNRKKEKTRYSATIRNLNYDDKKLVQYLLPLQTKTSPCFLPVHVCHSNREPCLEPSSLHFLRRLHFHRGRRIGHHPPRRHQSAKKSERRYNEFNVSS